MCRMYVEWHVVVIKLYNIFFIEVAFFIYIDKTCLILIYEGDKTLDITGPMDTPFLKII